VWRSAPELRRRAQHLGREVCDALLERGAESLGRGRLQVGYAPLAEHGRNPIDHLAPGAQGGLHLGDALAPERALREPPFTSDANGVAPEGVVGQQSLDAAPLVVELLHDLIPAAVQLADQATGGHANVVEEHLTEVALADHVDDRADPDAGGVHGDQELADAPMRAGRGIGAGDQVAVLRLAREARPDLLTADDEPVATRLGARRQADQIAAGVGLAHADAEGELAPRDSGHELSTLRLAAVCQQRRPDLAVPEPVRRHGSAREQQLLGHDQAVQVAALRPPVPLGPGQPDPATRAQTRREGAVEAGDPAVLGDGTIAERRIVPKKRPNLAS
jgi:hypothetical protein